jgi:hypothetical protein
MTGASSGGSRLRQCGFNWRTSTTDEAQCPPGLLPHHPEEAEPARSRALLGLDHVAALTQQFDQHGGILSNLERNPAYRLRATFGPVPLRWLA